MVKIGIIGGSGLDDPKILQDPETKEVETPYGKPSSPLTTGKIQGKDIVIIARHGKSHQFSPTQVNNRANIFALKQEGCSHILATTATGSLREDIGRGDFVILDQFILGKIYVHHFICIPPSQLCFRIGYGKWMADHQDHGYFREVGLYPFQMQVYVNIFYQSLPGDELPVIFIYPAASYPSG